MSNVRDLSVERPRQECRTFVILCPNAGTMSPRFALLSPPSHIRVSIRADRDVGHSCFYLRAQEQYHGASHFSHGASHFSHGFLYSYQQHWYSKRSLWDDFRDFSHECLRILTFMPSFSCDSVRVLTFMPSFSHDRLRRWHSGRTI